jgi:hypothetical protein
MKRLNAVLLSFVLLYAGAAHALAACLDGLDHAGHTRTALAESHTHQGISHDSGTHEHSAPEIHCADLRFKSSPAVKISLASRLPFAGNKRLPSFAVQDPASGNLANDLWLRTVFWWTSGLYPSKFQSLHLVLSVLRI